MTTGAINHQPKPQSLQFVALAKLAATDSSLIYTEIPTYAEWDAHGKSLDRCNAAIMWWIGDWFIYGENHFGEEAYQAVGDYEPETVRNAVWVASRVRQANRNSLSYSHHQEVAALEEHDQIKWLAIAESERLTKRELRASIKAGQVVRQADIDAQKQIAGALVDVELVFFGAPWQRFVKQQWEARSAVSIEEKRRWLEALREPARMAAQLEQELAAQ